MEKRLLRVRFTLQIKDVRGDYRPVVWPIKYPYWCSGETYSYGHDKYIMIAYIESVEELQRLWPEAQEIQANEVNEVIFTSRFRRPLWYSGPGLNGEGKRTEVKEE